MKILVVEDEKHISEIVVKYLEKENYNVLLAEDGMEAIKDFRSFSPDLVVLDIMIPYLDGFEVLKEIRKISKNPVIILSAKSSFTDRIEGLSTGADDYIIKPFSPKELLLRIEKLLNKTTKELKKINLGEIIIDLESGRCKCGKTEQILTSNELKMLELFINNEGRLFSRDNLIMNIFGYDYEGYDRNIDTLVKKLRKKIGDNPKEPKYIKTKYGKGYYFEKN